MHAIFHKYHRQPRRNGYHHRGMSSHSLDTLHHSPHMCKCNTSQLSSFHHDIHLPRTYTRSRKNLYLLLSCILACIYQLVQKCLIILPYTYMSPKNSAPSISNIFLLHCTTLDCKLLDTRISSIRSHGPIRFV